MAGINDDVARIAIVHTDAMDWQPSPSPTVWRKRLELHGDPERGRVTSVVRYDRDSRFPGHGHPEGEEILVLDGVFSDQHGDYPAGTYLLQPPGFAHAPFSAPGCVLFVKLRQYAGAGRARVAIDTRAAAWHDHDVPGVQIMPLYQQDGFPDEMRLIRLAPGARIPPQRFPAGEEIFVLTGSFRDEHGAYRVGSWVRYPAGSSHQPRSDEGCVLYVKKGHLPPGSVR